LLPIGSARWAQRLATEGAQFVQLLLQSDHAHVPANGRAAVRDNSDVGVTTRLRRNALVALSL